MGRPRKKPDFNKAKILDEILNGVVCAYEGLDNELRRYGKASYGALSDLSAELHLKPSKIRKLLITAGLRDDREYFANDNSRLVLKKYLEGKTISEIIVETQLKRSSVMGYLPYSKGVYRAAELSTDAERIRLYRDRQSRCRAFAAEILTMSGVEEKDYLWDTICMLEGCVFYTNHNKSVRYVYVIEGGDLVVKHKDIRIARDTVTACFCELQPAKATPEDMSRLSEEYKHDNEVYLYPIFRRLGLFDNGEDAEGLI